MSDQIAVNGQVYPDQAAMVVATHPDIPQELKDIFNPPQEEAPKTKIVVHPPSTASTMPLGSTEKPAGAFISDGGTPVPPQENASPEPSQSLPDIADVPHHDWIENAIKSAWEAMQIPGDVSQGKIDMSSPEGIKKANELALTMMGAPAPIVERAAAGEAILGSFAGMKSAGMKSRMQDLGHAQVLEANGVHPDDILSKTGFFRGADNRWRYEIDDSKSFFNKHWADDVPVIKETPQSLEKDIGSLFTQQPFNPDIGTKVTTLDKVLVHPELYQAYPFLKNVRVKYDPNFPGTAEWDNMNTITLGKDAVDNQGILMHEVQHAIQGEEGFAKGGSPGKADVTFDLKYRKDMEKLMPEARKLYSLVSERGLDSLSDAEFKRFQYLGEVFSKYKQYKEAGDKAAMENYMRLAGEAEARNTDTRLLLNARERRNLHPEYSQDIENQNQLVVHKPVMSSAYGVRDPQTGKLLK